MLLAVCVCACGCVFVWVCTHACIIQKAGRQWTEQIILSAGFKEGSTLNLGFVGKVQREDGYNILEEKDQKT